MRKKKLKWIAIALLGLVSFAGTFFWSGWVRPAPPPTDADTPEAAEASLVAALAQRPPRDLTPKEEYLQELIRDLQRKDAENLVRERKLNEREKRLDLALEHLRQEAERLEDLRAELVAPLRRLKELQAEIEATRVRIREEEKTNLKWMAGVYEKMDAAAGGVILAKMCSNRQEDQAVKILHYMADRSAAKLLAEIDDKDLAARLCQRLQAISEEG